MAAGSVGAAGSLVDHAYAGSLTSTADDAVVQAAMAHLNLVLIHPFGDGNGRPGRALQTLVLARRGLADPTLSSIEEWLGANTADCYRVLAHPGAGGWHPHRDTDLWVSFNLPAHHIQAQTLQHRIDQAMAIWAVIDVLSGDHRLPNRAGLALYEATAGYRVRRATYVKRAEVEERTASRDLKQLVGRVWKIMSCPDVLILRTSGRDLPRVPRSDTSGHAGGCGNEAGSPS